jgi:hypothetical protein
MNTEKRSIFRTLYSRGGRLRHPSLSHLQAGITALAISIVTPAVYSADDSIPQPEKAQVATVPALNETQPAFSHATRISEEMLSHHDPKVLILPSEPVEIVRDRLRQSKAAIGPVTPEKQLLPEGYVVAARKAQIKKQEDRYLAELQKQEGLPESPSLRILPNRRLSMVKTIVQETKESPLFVITGRVTEFKGENYILLESVAKVPEDQAVIDSSQAEAKSDGQSPKESPPASEMSSEPAAEEIIAELSKQKPLKRVALPERVREATTAPSPQGGQVPSISGAQQKSAARWPEGSLLINQNGRLVPSESGWMLAFEDQGKSPQRPPVRLLPNRLLERAISLSGGGAKGVVFTVSGEITLYEGTNYLLLRKVLVRRDLGNFH